MSSSFDASANFQRTRQELGYVERHSAGAGLYADLGFKCGLEIHQQLDTAKKLFCHCPAGIYQAADDYDAEVIRHMRPTLSEMGEYDGTALMERKTKKNIVYRIKEGTACTYEIDDTPPFKINREALDIAIEVALMLKTNVVGELHVTRKQYLDGSIPTGFQRTAIVGIEGEIRITNKPVRIIQLSIEEDSCREVSDVGHWRTYTTDRLGMPLIETVTYPDMLTPDEAAEAGQYLRFLTRSSGKVRTGIGAAREDVNVSITGGTRVEIKGVAHIRWIPELTHNEAFRQKALLRIRDILRNRVPKADDWNVHSEDIDFDLIESEFQPLWEAASKEWRLAAVSLPHFKGILSHFTQPGKMFANELSDRLKVIACLERPNILHSEQIEPVLSGAELTKIRELLKAGADDAQIVVWGPAEDVTTAIETIEERCRMAFEGVPNETRKSLADGTTIFERVLPGPDRMYPDTDSAPIAIGDEMIDSKRPHLPNDVSHWLDRLRERKVPEDTYHYLLKRNLMPMFERIVEDFKESPVFVASLLGHTLRHIEGRRRPADGFNYMRVYDLVEFLKKNGIDKRIAGEMLPVVYEHPHMDFEGVLVQMKFKRRTEEDIFAQIAVLRDKFQGLNHSFDPEARTRWIMGQLRPLALGNMPLNRLRERVDEELNND